MKKDRFDFKALDEAKQSAELQDQNDAKLDTLISIGGNLDTLVTALTGLRDSGDMEQIRLFVESCGDLPQLVDRLNEATQLKVSEATCKAYNSMVAKATKSAIKGMEASLKEAADSYNNEMRTFTDGQIKRLKETTDCVTTPPLTFWCFVTLFAALLSSFVIILFLNIFSWYIAPIYKAQLWPMGIALTIVAAIHIVNHYFSKH